MRRVRGKRPLIPHLRIAAPPLKKMPRTASDTVRENAPGEEEAFTKAVVDQLAAPKLRREPLQESDVAINLSLEPVTFPTADCANNAPFASM